jgi:multidrug efflux pump subunit AcrB
LSISHQGQFPAITISFNLAQGVALGQATDAVQKAMVDSVRPRRSIQASRAPRKRSSNRSAPYRC